MSRNGSLLFKGRHFDHEIIILCVRWYVTYKLSYRDLAAMMLERGIRVAPSTIFRPGIDVFRSIFVASDTRRSWSDQRARTELHFSRRRR